MIFPRPAKLRPCNAVGYIPAAVGGWCQISRRSNQIISRRFHRGEELLLIYGDRVGWSPVRVPQAIQPIVAIEAASTESRYLQTDSKSEQDDIPLRVPTALAGGGDQPVTPRQAADSRASSKWAPRQHPDHVALPALRTATFLRQRRRLDLSSQPVVLGQL